MLYFIQVNLYTMAMLAIYSLFLCNRPLYQQSRYYLISSALLPLILPLIHMPERYSPQLQETSLLRFNLPEILISATRHTVKKPGKVDW